MAPTLHDIARETGLSIATVSKCINGKTIRPENKKLIDEAIERLHYIRDDSARAMKTQSTGLVGIIVPSMKTIMIPEIARACSDALLENGYYPVLIVTHGDEELEKRYLRKFASYHFAGVISMPSCTDIETYRLLDANNIPYVFFEQNVPGVNANMVEFVCEEATRHMISMVKAAGHQNGAVIFGNENAQAFQTRSAGLRSLLTEFGYFIPDERIVFAKDTTILCGRDEMRKLLAMPERPSIVLCAGEELTIGAYSAIRQSELRIPDDISIIGIKNSPNFDFTSPLTISCLLQPNCQLALACVDRLFELMKEKEDGTSSEPTHTAIELEFIPGDTIANKN